ncbi:3-keto-disaccharide hydrolase [Sphingobacterium sp. Mn56C]|uniref:3-keto-disaccharide hydrolase n=1 Tax=Sphingobacterium sp. Mn56C TaxID=3395261 RepID=UPI003BD60C7D
MIKKTIKTWTCITATFTAVLFSACNSEPKEPNKLTEKEVQDGWTLLFDGKSLKGWHIFNKGAIPSSWTVRNGELFCDPDSKDRKGDLVSDGSYENYDLRFEWKLAKEGNSGVFINVLEVDTLNSVWNSGPEYQLLDDYHQDYDKPLKKAGCLYGFTPQKNLVKTKISGDWNQGRIVQENGKTEFYLNDVLTAEVDFKSPQWQKMVKQSTFASFPEFGKHTSGKIALQDWAHGVSFRNIKIKVL